MRCTAFKVWAFLSLTLTTLWVAFLTKGVEQLLAGNGQLVKPTVRPKALPPRPPSEDFAVIRTADGTRPADSRVYHLTLGHRLGRMTSVAELKPFAAAIDQLAARRGGAVTPLAPTVYRVALPTGRHTEVEAALSRNGTALHAPGIDGRRVCRADWLVAMVSDPAARAAYESESLDVVVVAADLGRGIDDVRKALRTVAAEVPELARLLDGGSIRRAAWESLDAGFSPYQRVARELGEGTPLLLLPARPALP